MKQRLPRAGRRRNCGLRRKKRAASTKRQAAPAESGALRETLRTSGQIERPGRPGGRKTPAGKSAAVFRRSEEARTRRAGTPSEAGDLRRPKDRGLPAKAPAHPFCGHAARGGRQAGYRRVQASCALPADLRASFGFFPASRKGRRGGFDAVAQRPRGREAFPQAEHGSKTGKEQQKGLPSPGQSRKKESPVYVHA